ncbi:MAG TPA: isoprenylcysteine carboxylmethyltransferase family protein [Candidatus Acidoferrales bacterium]|nr:isoprenylcysteine carboxylmethyltransferase family protein [Candidatus Acidoferrales bacterium]
MPHEITVRAFLALLAAVGVLRLVEVWVSRRHQRRLVARGASHVPSQHFGLMAFVHVAVLAGAAAEVVLLRRPFYVALAAPMFALFLAANLVRLWVIRTLGEHWSVQVMDSTPLGVVTNGPFRYIRHPNYAAVFVEMTALPLIHTAWITAIAGTLAHIWALRKRLEAEEPVLLADPDYRAAMAGKPRFLPRIL